MSEKKQVSLRAGERLDELAAGVCLIQRADVFCFGTDSVLLADFARPRKRERAADLGCGTGAIAALMTLHQPGIRVDALEIQPELADMAARSAAMNGFDALNVYTGDLRRAGEILGRGQHTLVVSNPPYSRMGAAIPNENAAKRIARHTDTLASIDLCAAAAQLLKSGGRFCVVYPSARAAEMLCAMRDTHLEPKRLRSVHARADKAPKIVLIEGMRDAQPGLNWSAPLNLYNADGSHSAEWKRIYREDEKCREDEK